ncbi:MULTISPECIES: NUDIX hydrolase [unclassified Cellulophaga]|uniref:NUDIX hydrolase n=1 Tax=unclassified Cellulophaga TaxID=2634405 RepID=UPI0026E3F983|nr:MULTISPECIES: NUDIX domain-containing protein [unclassified Cellulophaga]MDO6492961.1 NUDIX domain-containing protein [Cellulophaga sp. 2_MG-2023]MDO6496415.1 NUDIX domain-containing protein [Cellulophaga sp. 3_MG-2023]
MDELIDILDSKGNFTGKTALKSKAHINGWFHQTTHIWFYTNKKEILLQQRAKSKDTFPLLWDISVAGHIGAGENIIDSALREIKEEIGITVLKTDLLKIGCFKSTQKHSDDLIDCEFHHTFICKLKTDLNSLTKQDSEVENLQLKLISDFKLELRSTEKKKLYVPHNITYYNTVLEAIEKLL